MEVHRRSGPQMVGFGNGRTFDPGTGKIHRDDSANASSLETLRLSRISLARFNVRKMRGKPFYFLIVILSLSVAPAHQLIAGQVQPAKRPINENDLFDFVWIGDPQISPDGSQVIFYRIVPNKERTGYDGATWSVPTGGSAPPVELFSGNGARWSPDGQSILYRRDGQLWLFSLRTKESRKITSLPGGA